MLPLSKSIEPCEEDVLDAMIALGLCQYSEAEGRAIWQENRAAGLADSQRNAALQTKILRKFNAIKRRESFLWHTYAVYKKLAPVAMVFLILFSGVATVFASSDHFRLAVYRAIFKEEMRFLEMFPDTEHRAFVDSHLYPLDHSFAPTYMPSGFSAVDLTQNDLSISVTYRNAAGQYIIFRQASAVSSRADNERLLRQEYIQIADSAGVLLVTEDGRTILKWQVGESILTLISDYDEDELLTIAESIKILR